MTKLVSREYLAGILDGEGTIGIQRTKARGKGKSPRYDLYVAITNTHVPTLDTIQQQYGGYRGKTGYSGTNKQCYKLVWQNRKAENILRLVFPHLLIKRKQALLGLQYAAYLHALRPRGVLGLIQSDIRLRAHFKLAIQQANRA